MLKMTKNELKLITDPDPYISLKKVQEAKFIIFIIDTAKGTLST